MPFFLLGDYNILSKKELHWSPWVGSISPDLKLGAEVLAAEDARKDAFALEAKAPRTSGLRVLAGWYTKQ